MMVNTDNRLSMAALLVALFFSVLVIVAGAQGVRGTDQYNYLADTRTTLDQQAHVTNLLFPAKLIREGDSPTPAYFHHNGPPIQVAAWLGRWSGAYAGWILMNLLAHMIVGLSVYALARKVATQRIALWTTSLYLVSPSAIWLGINVLQEMFFAGLLALVLVGFVYRSRPAILALGSMALLVGVLCHPIFQAAALLLSVYVAIESMLARRYVLVCAALVNLGAVLFLMSQQGSWYPSSFQPDLTAIITSSIPGESNMFWHYSLEQRSISVQLLIDKLIASSKRHFLKPFEAPFFLYTNLAVVCLIYLAFRHMRQTWQLLLPVCLFLGLYAGMIVLQQNQPRYQQIVAVASFTAIALAWARSGFRIPDYALAIFLAGNLALGGYLSFSAAQDAQKESDSLEQFLIRLVDEGVEADARVAAFDLSPHSPLAVTLKPRQLLSIRTDMMSPDDISYVLSLYKPTHILVKADIDDAQLSSMIRVDLPDRAVLDNTFFGDLQLMTPNQ
ncbi:MAG: hypothetical protein AB8B97_00815 [Granulosicoccus sp.]